MVGFIAFRGMMVACLAMSPFAGHRIDRIDFREFDRSYPRAIGYNAKGGPHGKDARVTACRITTSQGASGWGFCGGGGGREPALRLVGRQLAELFTLESGAALEARCLDVALHDLAGRILGQPVWRLLGGRGGNRIPVYSGAIYFDDLAPPDGDSGVASVIASCRQDAALGHAHFKLKIGRGSRYMPRTEGDARDIAVTREVRRQFPQAKILVDANDGYAPAGICSYLEQVADCRLYWIEEPFEETEDGLRLLRDAISRFSPGTLIADGESRNGRLQDPLGAFGKWQPGHLEELYALAGTGLLDVLLMDVSAMGFTAWRQVLPRLVALGVQGSPHAWSEPYKTCYAAQLAGGLGGVPIVEGVPGRVEGVDDSGYVLADGVLTLPETPGLGLEVAW